MEGFYGILNGRRLDLEGDWLRQVVVCPCVTMRETSNLNARDRSPPGLTRTVASAINQDGGVKHATGASSKIRGRDITVGTWKTRTLIAAGKLQELTKTNLKQSWLPAF